jgi:hypothetical protein
MHKSLLVLFAFLLVSSPPALAQRGPVGVGIEVYGAYMSFADKAFEDPKPRPRIAGGWLNDVSRGVAMEGRVSIRLPWGIRPYAGYHVGRPRESEPTQELWTAIYSNGFPDFENTFVEERHTVENRTEGWSAGLMYEPHWLTWSIKPYLMGEIRTESFRSETDLEGVVDDENFPELTNAPFEGHSVLEAETAYGYGIGLGVRIPLSRMGLSMPLGTLSIIPEVKYVSVPDAQIERREFGWVVRPTDGPVVRRELNGFLDILDGQTIDHRYISFRLGLRYEPF